MNKVQDYIKKNENRFLKELVALLKIPSVSANPDHKHDMVTMANSMADHLTQAGADAVKIYSTPGHPIVYGEKLIDPEAPVVLVYGHYDVQPPDPLDLWDSPPFEPVIKKTAIHPEGAIFARGACDDKGQLFMHVKALESMVAEDNLPCNVKFILEGEEEVGSEHLEQFCQQHRELLACDVVLISDTSIIANEHPSITTGLRGLCYMEVEITGPNRDLHSGVYGGAVANPINILSAMIATLHDKYNHITIPGFYDKVDELSAEERQAMSRAPFDLQEYKKDLEIKEIHGEAGYTTLERTSIRPTLDVNGIWGGYIGEGAKTVLPSKAFAKMSMRLVPHQDPDEIAQLFQSHITSIAPPSVTVKVIPHHGGKPAVTPTQSIEYKAAALAMEKTFGKEPIPLRSGGSIPIVSLFEEILEAKTILLGFGLDSDAIHSPNEHYGIFNFYQGIKTIPFFFHYYAKLRAGK